MLEINSTVIATILNFVLLVALVRAVLIRPIRGVMERRAMEADLSRERLERERKKAETLAIEGRQAMEEARRRACEHEESAIREAERRADEIVERARQEAERMKEQARADAEYEKERAWESLRDRVVDLSIAAASRVVERALDTEDNRRLVREFIEEVEKAADEINW